MQKWETTQYSMILIKDSVQCNDNRHNTENNRKQLSWYKEIDQTQGTDTVYPQWEKQTEVTVLEWSSSDLIIDPLFTSHILTVKSFDPLIIFWPQGEIETEETLLVWPTKVLIKDPSAIFQILIVLSPEPLIIIFPQGEIVTENTPLECPSRVLIN